MAIVLDRLHHVEPSPEARRLLWHVLSIGYVSRNEIEHHLGLDKAGLFLFRIVSGVGFLEVKGRKYPLEKGDFCWLLDLRQARSYLPLNNKMLRTEGIRFGGPGMEAWLELLGSDPVFHLPAQTLAHGMRRLKKCIQTRNAHYEWQVHEELTALWGQLLATRHIFRRQEKAVPPAVQRVLDVVHADPARDWRARELAAIAGISYSRLREHFHRARGETLHDFLQRVRLDLARHFLSDQRLSVKEVAVRLNFSSEFYFSHFFHRSTGMSPSQFREHCRA